MSVSLSLSLLYLFQLVISGGQLLRPLVLFTPETSMEPKSMGHHLSKTTLTLYKSKKVKFAFLAIFWMIRVTVGLEAPDYGLAS